MKRKINLKLKYIFGGVAFLVITLAILMIDASLHREDVEQLHTAIQGLSSNDGDEQKIDDIIELLHNSENNAQMSAAHPDSSAYLNLYTSQLKSVDSLIQSIGDTDKINSVENIKDKQLKSQLFIQARVLVDSLLLNSNDSTNKRIAELQLPKVVVYSPPPKIVSYTKADTTKAPSIVKKKKGLLTRIGEAIKNRQDTNAVISENRVDSVVIQKNYTADSAIAKRKNNVLLVKQSDFQNNEKNQLLSSLRDRELRLLDADSKLFYTLQNLLQQLKQNEKIAEQQRNKELSKSAAAFTHDLQVDNDYIIFFSLLLSLIILTVLDILYRHELKLEKTKQQAENYAQQKSAFAATISHEIRNSIFSIDLYADELVHAGSPARQAEAVNAIKVSSDMLQEVVNNVLDLSKMEQGKFQLKSQPFNPKDVFAEMLAGFAIHVRQKGLQSHSVIDESADRTVYGDAFYLRQVLLNLLNNALKYTPKGSITVTANLTPLNAQKVLLHVTVSDTGIGIAENNLPHIFDEFNTQENNADIVVSSSGLGLSMVKKIIDLQNGSITVESKVDEGSTFSIAIPYAIKEAAQQTKKQISSAGCLKILLVENDRFNQVFLSQMLGKRGYALQLLNSAEDALQWLDNNTADLILTDIGLPKMNGVEFVKRIKALNNANASVPVFCLSGYKENELDAPKNLFNEWIVKPFTPETLLQKIDDYFVTAN